MPAKEVGRKSQFRRNDKTTLADEPAAGARDMALDRGRACRHDGPRAAGARGNPVMSRSRALTIAAACAAALVVAALFWRSLTSTLAGWIVDFFVAVVRLFLALAHFLF